MTCRCPHSGRGWRARDVATLARMRGRTGGNGGRTGRERMSAEPSIIRCGPFFLKSCLELLPAASAQANRTCSPVRDRIPCNATIRTAPTFRFPSSAKPALHKKGIHPLGIAPPVFVASRSVPSNLLFDCTGYTASTLSEEPPKCARQTKLLQYPARSISLMVKPVWLDFRRMWRRSRLNESRPAYG